MPPLFYTADWNSIKLSAAYGFTWNESNTGLRHTFDLDNNDFDDGNCFVTKSLDGGNKITDCGESRMHQIGASILHKPSGFGIYGMWQQEEVDGGFFLRNPSCRRLVGT